MSKFNACTPIYSPNFRVVMIRLLFDLHRVFDGRVARIEDFVMTVNEKIIDRAIRLSIEGKKWFKNRPVEKQLCVQLLKPKHQNVHWE
jgi:hypothetical protein